MRPQARSRSASRTDLTGPIGYAGNADANVAKMVIKEINDAGGLLGRPLELYHRGHRVQ